MKDGLVCIDISSALCPKVDHNKRFVKMVHINRMFDDGGG
jgi:hypothetical protein